MVGWLVVCVKRAPAQHERTFSILERRYRENEGHIVYTYVYDSDIEERECVRENVFALCAVSLCAGCAIEAHAHTHPHTHTRSRSYPHTLSIKLTNTGYSMLLSHL